MNEIIEFIKDDLLLNSKRKKLKFLYILFNKGNLNALFYTKMYLIISNKNSKILKVISIILKNLLIKNYGIEISRNTKIGKNFRFGHANGIILGEGVSIGDDVVIYQQVTIGLANINDKGQYESYPEIGDKCVLYAGSKVIGDIKLGEGTIVGANAVLLKSTEKNSCYVGIPAKNIKKMITK